MTWFPKHTTGPDPALQFPSQPQGQVPLVAATKAAHRYTRRPDVGLWVDANELHPRGADLVRNAGLDPDGKWWRD